MKLLKFAAALAMAASALWADFYIDLSSNIATLKMYDGYALAGLEDGRLYRITLDANATDASAAHAEVLLELPQSKSYATDMAGSKIVDLDELGGKFALLYDGDYMHKYLGIVTIEANASADAVEMGKRVQTYDLPITGIKRLFFADSDTVMLLGMGSEILYFDLPSASVKFEQKLSIAPLGGVAFDRGARKLLLANEGGVLSIFDIDERKILREIPVQKDNVFSVAMMGERLASGSNDKTAYYQNGNFSKFFDAKFIVYSVALSQNLGAYTDNDGIEIFDLNGNKTKFIPYDKEILNYLYFWDDLLIGCGYDKRVHFWSYR